MRGGGGHSAGGGNGDRGAQAAMRNSRMVYILRHACWGGGEVANHGSEESGGAGWPVVSREVVRRRWAAGLSGNQQQIEAVPMSVSRLADCV